MNTQTQTEAKQAKLNAHKVRKNLNLIIIPSIFGILTILLVCIAVLPISSSLFNVISLITGNTEQAPRDLLENPTYIAEMNNAVVNVILESDIEKPNLGDRYGQLNISGTIVNAPVYWNDSARELNNGIGTYTGAWLPGYGRTVMMTGHNNTFFNNTNKIKVGATITLQTHYGTYEYEVTSTEVKHMDDASAYDLTKNEENLILYTCYPFDYIGVSEERFFIYAKLISGATVKYE